MKERKTVLNLVDSKSLTALGKFNPGGEEPGLANLALCLADQANTFAAEAATTFRFRDDESEVDGKFVVDLTITVRRPRGK